MASSKRLTPQPKMINDTKIVAKDNQHHVRFNNLVTSDHDENVSQAYTKLQQSSRSSPVAIVKTPTSATASASTGEQVFTRHTCDDGNSNESSRDNAHNINCSAPKVNSLNEPRVPTQMNDSGDSKSNDDNYESANEDSNHESVQRLSKVGGDETRAKVCNRVVQTVNAQQQVPVRHQHQLQLRSKQTSSTHQQVDSVREHNLARGKQQRASISSCSSSDSYVSYGSGYASGSGNSTDHEHKNQQIRTQDPTTTNTASSNHDSINQQPTNASILVKSSTADDNVVRSDKSKQQDDVLLVSAPATIADEVQQSVKVNLVKSTGADDESDEDTQLKRHLSELEQLTDELANRDIFQTLPISEQHTSKLYTPTARINSSQTSSILSTGSDHAPSISSCLDNDLTEKGASKDSSIASKQTYFKDYPRQDQEAVSTTLPPPPPPPLPSYDSRSTSVTPTFHTQSNSLVNTADNVNVSTTLQSSTSNSCQANKTRQAIQPLDSLSESVQRDQIMKPKHHFTMEQQKYSPESSSLSNSTKQRSNDSQRTPTKQQPIQEPYYHNLFQWEQLVSKGVTRPLLINDLDFTDLRDEDDCDLLSGSSSQSNTSRILSRNQVTGEPLTISIPSEHQHSQKSVDHDSVDSGASTGSPSSQSAKILEGSATAPPPLPPPPISPWFNTLSGSRPQSQFMSSPSPPPYDFNTANSVAARIDPNCAPGRDQSPSDSTYSNYSRNSVCVPRHTDTTMNHYNTMQPASSLRSASSMSSLLFGNNHKFGNKRKKTMKLFWKEVREDRSLLSKLTKKKTIWDEIKPTQIDTQKLEYLFESKAKDLLLSKSRNGLDGANQRKVKITVLDAKRSNAINIGMTKLPPMRTIKSAILKMDSSIMNREGIEKILTTMMPSEEEKSRIIEAQLANPDTPLGTAEQFLLNLASISALEARLKLWAFQLDYSQIEKEVAEPLMDLKQAIEEIERSETFRAILGTLLAIGNFLNSTSAKGFQIDYLEKVPEVKDTVHKHSLLHHLCLFIQEKYDPELTSDLYSEFSAVNRASKVDYTEVAKNLKKMQQDCKASWDYLKIVAKHDGLASLMNTCGVVTSQQASNSQNQQRPKSSGKLNNLSKLSMITSISSDNSGSPSTEYQQHSPTTKQLKTKVSDFLTDCAERIMVLIVIHRRVMNRFQKLLVYLGCPSHTIKQTQPQQILKIINEFALEYRTKRERVREMLMKKQQCVHHNHHANRWQMNRMRWAGSQHCIDSLGYNNRPSSTASFASSYVGSSSATGACPECALESRHRSLEPLHQQQVLVGQRLNRPGSPSGLSQISNYSDYLFDQSCNSRQESITPVPSDKMDKSRRACSMSMFDLQNQQDCLNHHSKGFNTEDLNKSAGHSVNEDIAREKDEQMRRLLGAGKSLEGACQDLYQMGHWSTMNRVVRQSASKQRSTSIDSSPGAHKEEDGDLLDQSGDSLSSKRRQSSYYRYLNTSNGSSQYDDDLDHNSDEEILKSLVKTASKSGRLSSGNLTSSSGHSSNKSAKNKILSRFSCDRKSLRRSLGPSVELSNA